MLAKIRALLAKAESTTFPEEAESLSAKAQELMTRHRVDRVLLDGEAPTDGPTGRRIWLDDPYATTKADLLRVVADANRCRAVLLPSLGCCHVIGHAADLDMSELLHTRCWCRRPGRWRAPAADRRSGTFSHPVVPPVVPHRLRLADRPAPPSRGRRHRRAGRPQHQRGDCRLTRQRYPESMAKTSIEIDRDIARAAAEVLGTTTLRDTVDAALREIVDAKRRLELVALLGEEGRFDFTATDAAWGGGET
jgi:Arc/MetJ family transcription regulator